MHYVDVVLAGTAYRGPMFTQQTTTHVDDIVYLPPFVAPDEVVIPVDAAEVIGRPVRRRKLKIHRQEPDVPEVVKDPPQTERPGISFELNLYEIELEMLRRQIDKTKQVAQLSALRVRQAMVEQAIHKLENEQERKDVVDALLKWVDENDDGL